MQTDKKPGQLKPAPDTRPSGDVTKTPWWRQMIANMTRMAADEEYRKEVAKRIF